MPLERLGPYRLSRVLGRGGMGTVYAAEHEATGEPAAVKVLSAALAEDPGFQARFKQEIETLKKLRHPNIVQMYGFGAEDELLFYSMELVEGQSLQEELSLGRRFTWREVTRYGIMIARALKHAHDRGIIHRDLKPANLMLDPREQIKLTDFGIAKLFGATNLTMSGGVIGTADYMSPEQAEGKGVNARSDLFSLGAVLYALLCGRPPFSARTVTEVLNGLKNDKPVELRHLVRDAPPELSAIVMQLLEKDPSQRVATALTVANRLQAMEHALSIETRIAPAEEVRLELPPEENMGRRPVAGTNADAHAVTAELDAEGNLDVYRLAGENDATFVPANPGAELTGKPVPEHTELEVLPSLEMPLPSAIAPNVVKTKHFITMAEEEQASNRTHATHDEDLWTRWLSLAGIIVALLVLAGIAWMGTRPPSEATLLERIQKGASAGEVQKLVEVESDIQQYLRRFGDSEQAPTVQQYLEEIELYRLEKQFDFKARRLNSADAMLPIERAYLEAMRLAPTEPAAALARLEAIPQLFGGTDKSADDPLAARSIARCLELARKQAERLRITTQQLTGEDRMFLRKRLEDAQRLADKNSAEASDILRGIIILYADRPWARDFVEEARKKLAELPGGGALKE